MSLVFVSPFLTAARETGPTVIGPFPARRLAKATHNKAALKQSGETRTTGKRRKREQNSKKELNPKAKLGKVDRIH